MRIKFIVPVITNESFSEIGKSMKRFVSPGTEIEIEAIEYGTTSIESIYDETVNSIGVLRLAEKAQAEGFDGVFIECMGDPALDATREKLDIPVVGPGRVAMLYAADLASAFSVIAVLENMKAPFQHMAHELGLQDKLVSVRSIDTPVLDLMSEEEGLEAVVRESIKAIEEDGAHAIIPGCTRMMGMTEDISKALMEKGFEIPVIHPVRIALNHLETLIRCGLTHSKRTYMKPPKKKTDLWDRLRLRINKVRSL